MSNIQSGCQERHVLVINDGKRRAIALDAAAYSIGRDASNAIMLPVDTISRQHAMLLRVPVPGTKQYKYRVIDGNSQGKPSANGIFVNGQKCPMHDLNNGDTVRFGLTVEASYLMVSMGEAEFVNYLESISYQSIKSDTINAKETLVAACLFEDNTVAPTVGQTSMTQTRQPGSPAPWAETMHEDQNKTGTKVNAVRLWMILGSSLLLVGAAVGIWLFATKSRPSTSSAAPIHSPAMVKP